MTDGWGLARWFALLLLAAGAFLPVGTLRNRVARIVFGLVATAAVFGFTIGIYLASRPDAGLTALGWAVLAAEAFTVVLVLFLIGAGAGVSRVIAKVRGTSSPWWVAVVASGILIASIFGASAIGSRTRADSFYRKNAAIVAAARDSARPQTQAELVRGVVAGLNQAATGNEAAYERAAVDTLMHLWHPGVLKATEYFNVRPGSPRMTDNDPRFDLEVVVGRNPRAQPGDTFRADWRGEVAFSAIPDLYRRNLSFFDDRRWNGTAFRDGRPLFPAGRYYQLDVSRITAARQAEFLTLYAISDDGKWWLIGLKEPQQAAVDYGVPKYP